MEIKICLAGATGKVGSQLVEAILNYDDLKLLSAVGKKHAGQNLSQVLNLDGPEILIDSDISIALTKNVDILIDYTKPDVVFNHVLAAIEKGIHVVIGTSGLSDDDYKVIDKNAKQKSVGVFAAGNFSLTATLLQHFALSTAKHIPQWEIFDYAPDTKPDSPSGTTRELSYQLSKIRKPKITVPPEKTEGIKESRGATLNNSQLHSIRLPGYYSSSEIVFGLPGERLSLRHDSISAAPYVEGTLLAARKVSSFVGLRRGLSSILDLEG